jgi:hypothetical protein
VAELGSFGDFTHMAIREQTHRLVGAILLALVFTFSACTAKAPFPEMYVSVTCLKEFHSLFPMTRFSQGWLRGGSVLTAYAHLDEASYSVFKNMTNSWAPLGPEFGIANATTRIYGRYELEMNVPVKVKQTKKNDGTSTSETVSFDKPMVTILQLVPDQSHFEPVRILGPEEWAKVVAAGGDFNVVGVALVKDKPFPEFDRDWKAKFKKK